MKLNLAIFIIAIYFSPYVFSAEPTDFDEIPEFVVKNAGRSHIKQLREGGYVLYMRHGLTDTSHPDQLNIDLNNCATQRPLSEEGIRAVTKIGKSIRTAGIPIGEVFSSPMCRTKDTALFAFGKNFIVTNQLMYRPNLKDKDKLQALEITRELLSRPLQEKVNRVVIAHSQNLMHLIGYLPSPEGVVVIFKPLGNMQFEYIATVDPDQWKFIQQ